jgi:hypothetical protein
MNDFCDGIPPIPGPLRQLAEAGFRMCLQMGLGTAIKYNGLCRPCVATGIEKRAQMKPTGFEVTAQPAAEMLRTDFDELKLENQCEVTINGVNLLFDGLSNGDYDPADPCVSLKFKHRTKNNAGSRPSNTFRG